MKAAAKLAGVVAIVVGVGAEVAAASESFDPGRVARGTGLAAIGNCITCHTSAEGKALAGGRALATPFGAIYSTNITPDGETGIGRWTESDFRRAMHEGIDREGRDLYPAFPYDHFTRVDDEDISALYAYLMTRDPVRATVPPNRLRFPMNLRVSIRLWKAMYFRPASFTPDPSRSAEWNRGSYLVEGLAHCGACHTPRNTLGAEQRDRALDGGDAEGWHATSLARDSPPPVQWTADALYAYLRRGQESQHGTAAGPMADVTHNLAQVSESDVRAIAGYVASQMPDDRTSVAPRGRGVASGEGEQLFAGACAVCHGAIPPGFSGAAVALGLTTSLNAPDARNTIHVIMEGLRPEAGEGGAWMPGFAGELTDRQIAALVDYLRARFTDRSAWQDVPQHIAAIRQSLEEEP
jgi:mono/diheme cytochrome c family protein